MLNSLAPALRISRVGFTWATLLWLASGLPSSTRADPPTAEDIRNAIGELGADEFSRREAAGDFLWHAGMQAFSPLREATKSTDPEVRARAKALLHKIRLGLAPDTSAEILSLVDEFQSVHLGYDRREIVRKLAAPKLWRTIYELLRTLPDVEDRRVLLSTLTKDIQASISNLIQQEQWSDAEAALQVLVTSDANTLPQLLAFLVVTNRLDAAIDDWQMRLSDDSAGGRVEDWIRLTYLYRAKGDSAAMLAAAEHTADPIKRMYLFAETGRWRDSARLAEELYQAHPDHFELVSWAATCYQLADDSTEFQRMLGVVADKVRVDLEAAEQAMENRVLRKDLMIAAKALLVNERIDEALAILRRIDPSFAQRIYWWQHRHREALDLAEVKADEELDAKWLAQLPMPLPLEPVSPDYRFNFAAQIARQLRELGRNEQAVHIWKSLRELESPDADGAKRLSLLSLLAWQLGRDHDATRTAAEAIAAGATPAALMNLLAGRHGPLAQVWYERALAANPKVDRAVALTDALRMVLPTPRHGQPPANWLENLTTARASLTKLTPPARAARLVLFGHTAEIRGDDALASELFLEAMATDAKYAQQAGEIEARAGHWDKAAKHFGAAATGNPANRIAKYLWADALLRAGEKEAGKRQMCQINLEVIAPDARFSLATQLVQPWLRDELFRQHEILCRTALPITARYANASRDRGNHLSPTQPEQAIHGWMQEVLHVLSPTSHFTEPEGYVAVAHMVHKIRARVAIDAGNAEVAERKLNACDRIQPGDSRLATFILPRLRSQSMDDLADRLLEKTFAAQLRICHDFPQAATARNGAAWLCARSQRKLDEALRLVQEAIALEPDVAAYHDTLAEVHFQLGNREAAIAAARRCLELTGPTRQSTARLRHFSENELRTLDGTR